MRQPKLQARLPAKANSDWRRLLRRARKAGWSAQTTANNHVRLTKPGRQTQVLSLQAGDPRALHNAWAALARAERNAHGVPR